MAHVWNPAYFRDAQKASKKPFGDGAVRMTSISLGKFVTRLPT
jgi:hypothetical protein